MRKVFSFFPLLLSVQLFAQTYPVTGIIILLPTTPDANISQWSGATGMFSITASVRPANGRIDERIQDSKILVTIKKGGAKICGTYTSISAPASNFNTATKVWAGNNAVSLLGQECTLPPGDYELSVQFFVAGPAGTVPLSEEKRRPFSIRTNEQVNYQPPQLVLPVDGATLSEANIKSPIIFRWTPVVPRTRDGVTYHLKVWQLNKGQNNVQAIQTNQPIVNKNVNDLTQTTILNLISEPCEPPNLCHFVWNVQALDKEGKPIGGKDGRSNSNSFSVGNLTTKSKSGDTTATAKVNPPPTDTGTAAIGDTIRAGFDGEFLIAVTQVTKEADGSITGKGTVTVNWLSTNIAVEFSKIRIDSTKRLTAGGIVTEKSAAANYFQAWLIANLTAEAATIPLDKPLNWTNNTVDNLIGWANNHNFGLPDINYQSNIAAPPIPANSLKMPFGIKFNDPDDQLMITEIIFKSNVSKTNFLVQKKFTRGVTDYKLGFAGKYFEIHPNRIDFSNGRVELVEDIDVPNIVSDPKMKFTFKKGVAQTGCFVEWDSSGLKSVSLGMDVKFTRDWLLPVPTATDSVKAIISGIGSSFKDILLTGSLPHCEIVGTKGTKLLADSICLDLSQTRNASAMFFPSNYTSDTSAVGKLLWEGLYIKTLKLTLPEAWKTGPNPTQITATNTLIDDFGVTMKVKAINIITFPMGRVADMSASLDTVNISMLKGSLTDGNAKGKLVLPISRDTITNTLKYTATFAQAGGNNNFQIVIVPTDPIDADVLKGTMTLSQTSNITANFSDTAKSVAINLNGDFDWGKKDLAVTDTTTATGGAPIRKKGIKGLKMEMAFQNLSIGYTSNSVANTNTMNFNPGSWSFASPQKRLANFPVSIKNVHYKSLPMVATGNASIKELVRGALMIDIVANLTDDIGGSTTVGGAFAIQINTTTRNFLPKFKGVFIEDIEVHADMPAVKIDGKLKMYDNDAVYGDGFLATLGVTFNAVSLQANALVQFGNTVYNNNNQYYRYWRAEADVKFEPGIPFLTGVGFYGFGGGAFFNMQANLVHKAAPEIGFKYSFIPKKSSLGFVATATVATLPKFETFNTDVKLLAQFAGTGGLTKLGFTGDFWLAAKLSERPDSKIKGGVAVEYNFPDKIFYMAALLSVNVPPAITTPSPVGFVMNINGLTNKWYFKAGTPAATNNVNIFGIDLYSYLMFGNDIPTPNGFTPRFANNYYNAVGSAPNNGNVGTGGVGINTATGKGIASGVGIEFSRNISKHLYEGTCRNWSIGGNVLAGAELNLALMHQTGCVGINGYRASGNIGLYGSVDATISGINKNNSSGTTLCPNKSISLFRIKTGAWLTGKFPNSEYVAGTLSANIDLFDGLCQVSYSQSFEKGIDCSGTVVVIADAPQEDEAEDLRNKLIQSIAPNQKYNFSVASPINVKYALVPEKIFDVAENQGDGTTKNRTFKMVVTRSLEVKNASGAWVLLILNSKVNNMGEYQYYTSAPISAVVTTLQVSSTQPTLNANNGNTLMTTNGVLHATAITSPVPPPPPPNYPNPLPAPVNHLAVDNDYNFKVTATLKELINNSWVTALTRTGLSVTETKSFIFRTGGIPVMQVNSATPKAK
ncbi:MAG TPA: hypothetical protein VM368_04375 [Flavisolibacter sp.]|nr:hypothetical protein [Flavisolibacter sp.]